MLDVTALAGDPHWVLQSAEAINGAGEIAGVGLHDGLQRAFVLVPREE